MNAELKIEIDSYLQSRKDFKAFLDDIKKSKGTLAGSQVLISLKIDTFMTSYNDLGQYVVELFELGYLSKEEVEVMTSVLKENEEFFYPESEELSLEINTMRQRIDESKIEESIQALEKCFSDKYSLYVLQRAAFEYDYLIATE